MVRKSAPVNKTDKDICTFGGRLWAERDRLGLKQADVCHELSLSKTTQIQYESNKSRPDVDYLVRISALGFDLMYLLTGVRGAVGMTPEVQRLVEAYQAASEDVKRAVFGALLASSLPEVEAARLGASATEIAGQLPGEMKLTYKQGPTPTRLLQDGDPEAKDGTSGDK